MEKTYQFKYDANSKAHIRQNRNGNWTLEIDGEKRYYKTLGGAERYLKSLHYVLIEDTLANADISPTESKNTINAKEWYTADDVKYLETPDPAAVGFWYNFFPHPDYLIYVNLIENKAYLIKKSQPILLDSTKHQNELWYKTFNRIANRFSTKKEGKDLPPDLMNKWIENRRYI